MDLRKIQKIIIWQIVLFSLFWNGYVKAQGFEVDDERSYKDLMDAGEYEKAQEKIFAKLKEINSKNTKNKRIPSNFISFVSIEQEIDINSLFNERTVENFLIEDNPELHQLHLDAALVNYQLKEYKRAASYLHQSLRYKPIEFKKDDNLFSLMSQIYLNMDNITAYRNSLELAFKLNPAISKYSKDLGLSYYESSQKKKAIYYLVNYVKMESYEIEDKKIFVKIANLNADINRNLEAQKYYLLYLEKSGDDYDIYYVVGNLAFNETGNLDLAQTCYMQVVQNMKDEESLKKSKSMEHLGDIAFKKMYYNAALEWYLQSIELEKGYRDNLENKRTEIKDYEEKINNLKIELLKSNNYVQYNEYQFLRQELARLKREEIQLNYELRKHASGKRRWKTAIVYEKTEQLNKAIDYYRESIKLDYKSNEARERIEKIQLKINRGY